MPALLSPNLPNWSLSLRSYILPSSCFFLRIVEDTLIRLRVIPDDPFFDDVYIHVIVILLLLVATKISVAPSRFGVCWRAQLLGFLLDIGLTLAVYSPCCQIFGMYLVVVSFFHWSEYMIQSVYNPKTTGVDSYMLYHSNAYVIAIAGSLLEYFSELYFYPNMKSLANPYLNGLSNIGVTVVMCGEMLRKISMITAKHNFNHHIQYNKAEDHELVTHGVYSFFRHPSYVGWFWWSVGTQVMLINPVCTVLFSLASWAFFSDRIYEEEQTLTSFFGKKYTEYQKMVGTGLPFISGYRRPSIHKKET